MKYYYCYSNKKEIFNTEIKYAKELGLYIFYNEEEDTFYDTLNNQINIKGMHIFPRTCISQTKTLMKAIKRHQGINLLNDGDFEKTLNWPYYINTIRNNIILSGTEILNNPSYIRKVFGNNKVFFKTKKKNFSQVIEVSQFDKHNSPFIKTIKKHANEDFIISDEVFIEHDEHGPLEYRAFIINSNIYNISRISNTLLSSIPKEIINKLQETTSNLKETDFPSSYVIDLFIYKDKYGNKEIDVLECNPIIASGIYLYNSVIEKIEDIEHICPSASIPKEKIKYDNRKKYSFNAVNNLTPSIYYKLPGGFAADLASFTIFDEPSTKKTYLHFSGKDINLLDFSNQSINIVITDDELTDNELPDNEISDNKLQNNSNKTKKLSRLK